MIGSDERTRSACMQNSRAAVTVLRYTRARPLYIIGVSGPDQTLVSKQRSEEDAPDESEEVWSAQDKHSK